MNSAAQQEQAIYDHIKANPGVSREKLVDVFPGFDLETALRMLGNTRNIKRVVDTCCGWTGYYAWTHAARICTEEKRRRYIDALPK